jgi:hypothetical protein
VPLYIFPTTFIALATFRRQRSTIINHKTLASPISSLPVTAWQHCPASLSTSKHNRTTPNYLLSPALSRPTSQSSPIMPFIIKIRLPNGLRKAKHGMQTRAKSRKALFKKTFAPTSAPSSTWSYERILACFPLPHKIKVRRPRTLSICRVENAILRVVRSSADNFETF